MPKVLPVLNSNTPAMSWATPPYAKARGTTAATAAGGRMPALTQLRTTVVRPKAANPSGPGLAALNAGGGKAISLSIVLVSSVPLYQLRTHLTDRSLKPIPGKEQIAEGHC